MAQGAKKKAKTTLFGNGKDFLSKSYQRDWRASRTPYPGWLLLCPLQHAATCFAPSEGAGELPDLGRA